MRFLVTTTTISVHELAIHHVPQIVLQMFSKISHKRMITSKIFASLAGKTAESIRLKQVARLVGTVSQSLFQQYHDKPSLYDTGI